jgi:squalene synthase HpnC
VADDVADEGNAPASERQAALAEWRARLHRAADDTSLESDGPVFVALGHSIRTLDLPVDLFDDLLSAFAQDTTTVRYASWAEVLDYCRRSANPVGRIVLRIAGYRDDALDRSSDALCTALQLTNFWQDFGRDWRAGRLYVPREVAVASGAREEDLAAGVWTPAWSDALRRAVVFTRALFGQGRAVCDGVTGRLRWELRLTWAGGSRILDRVDAHRADALQHRPALGAADAPALAWRALRWNAART